MRDIGQPIRKLDHAEKADGTAKYIGDYQMQGMQYACAVRSQRPHARLVGITYPAMEAPYFAVDASDRTDFNYLRGPQDGQRIFAQDEVNYVGEAIALICGPKESRARAYAQQTVVQYEDLPAECSIEASTCVQVEYAYHKADVQASFARAARTYEETFRTGYQEQIYLETNGMIARWAEDKLIIYGSMQNPYYIKHELQEIFRLRPEQIQVVQAVTGGGFGGKEDYPSLVAAQAAVAAMKSGLPVRLVLGRREDILDSPKRHPAKLHYQVALDADGSILGMRVQVLFDGGAYQTVSGTVMQRCLITCTGVYDIPSLDVQGKVMRTHQVPSGAFRGFGAPQSFYAIETLMNHLAQFVGEDPLVFKMRHAVIQGSSTATSGRYKYPVLLPEMVDRACVLTDYEAKRTQYAHRAKGRYQKGIGMALSLHGCGFTGSAEKDFLKSVAALHKRADGGVEILASSADMGQGVKTTFCKIVAETLELPIGQMIIANPDTDQVPNSGPTVASRSIMIVGHLLEKAAMKLKETWLDGQPQTIVEHYVHPDMIPWDLEQFSGDPYPTYSWGVNVVEVQLDTLTGEATLLGGCGVYDVGKAIDEQIVRGQIEGGMLQGIGYGSMEKMEARAGVILQDSMSNYMVPTAMDSASFKTCTIENPYENGPFGAKGAGELTVLGGAPAYVQAVEQASGKNYSAIPVTPEKILEA